MNRMASFLHAHVRWAWVLIVALGCLAAGTTWTASVWAREQHRQSHLQTKALREAQGVMSTTLNGNLMGALTLLGVADMDIKQDAQNGLLSTNASIGDTLSVVASLFGAESVYVVAHDGIVKSFWDRNDMLIAGMDAKFRPYYAQAIQGRSSVYPAASLVRGERSLYFAAPVYAEHAMSTSSVGAVVARTTMERLDALLQQRFDIALLLSPQGVVFASSRSDWIGRLEGLVTPQRLKAIRDLKQYGGLFDKTEPDKLPVALHNEIQSIDAVRYAVAVADVEWHDPAGPWKLVVMEDLSRTVPWKTPALWVLASAVLVWLLGWMSLSLVKGRYVHSLASTELQRLAAQQEHELQFRRQLGEAMVHLQQSQTVAELGRVFLRDAHALFGVLQGVVYVCPGTDPAAFSLQAAFACDTAPPPVIQAGEGLLGQCALERTLRVIVGSEPGFWSLRSGLGSSAPRTLVMAPVIRNEQVLGMVEIALLTSAQNFVRHNFEEFVHLLGLNLQILLRSGQMHEVVHPAPQIPADRAVAVLPSASSSNTTGVSSEGGV